MPLQRAVRFSGLLTLQRTAGYATVHGDSLQSQSGDDGPLGGTATQLNLLVAYRHHFGARTAMLTGPTDRVATGVYTSMSFRINGRCKRRRRQ